MLQSHESVRAAGRKALLLAGVGLSMFAAVGASPCGRRAELRADHHHRDPSRDQQHCRDLHGI